MAAVSLSSLYSQNFDGLPNSGSATFTNDSTILGWYSARTGTGTTIVASDGSSTTGNLYSFGTGTNSDRALGSIGSGNAAAGSFFWGVRLVNDTASTIPSLTVGYTGEQWRNSAATAQTVDFQYQIGATSLTAGTWTDFNTLDFTSPITGGTAGALNGNSAANRTTLSSTITSLNIAPGQEIWLRWSDPDHTGTDHGLAIDDFSVSAGGGITPTLSLSITPNTFAENAGTNAATATLTRSDTSTSNLLVNLSSNDTTEATVPATVSFIGNSPTVTFPVDAVDDAIADGTQSVTITAAAGGFTSGTANVSVTDNEVAINLIHNIQGNGTTSPVNGTTKTIQGIVVGNFPNASGLSGFYVEEEDADQDADLLTSEGIFIFSSTPVNVGDKVTVTGTVSEFGSSGSNLTEITPSSPVTIVSSGNPLPSAVNISLPASSSTDFERYEGMRVTFSQPLTVTETFQLGRFGQVTLSSGGRLFTPTNIVDPNDNPASGTNSSGTSNVAAVTALQNSNDLSKIVLDDGSNDANPTTTPFIDPVTKTLRIGSTVNNLTGILDDRFGAYRIQPTVAPSINYASRPSTPPSVGAANVKVASFNVLNYFNDLNNGATVNTPNGLSFVPRGANNANEFTRQQTKIVKAITQMNADVVGLTEIENNGSGSTSAIKNLVEALNVEAGAGTYAYINDPANYNSLPGGTDAIKVAFIYQPSKVTPVGNAISPNDSAFTNGRAPIAQTFTLNSNGAKFTPIINHFKSKSSSAGLPGDTDQGDGQGQSNATRKLQATALLNFISQVQTSSGDADVVAFGDFNAYNEEDPLDILRAGGLIRPNTSTESYVFNGQTGSLDHAFITSSLSGQLTGTEHWNINSDEPNALDYNDNVLDSAENPSNPPYNNDTSLYAANPFRSSDHDPVLVGLNLTGTSQISGTPANDVLTGTAGADSISGGAGSDVVNGGAGNDTINGGADRDILVGGLGADVFAYGSLTDSTATAADAIRDFGSGADRFQLPFIPTGLFDAGTVAGATLADAATAAFATASVGANQGVFFTWTPQGRKFLAVNDTIAGFSPTNDLVVELPTATVFSTSVANYFV